MSVKPKGERNLFQNIASYIKVSKILNKMCPDERRVVPVETLLYYIK